LKSAPARSARPSNRWKRFIECSQKKQLKIIAKFYKEPRPEFIKLLHTKNKDIPTEVDQQVHRL
jgi:hypothetical protein